MATPRIPRNGTSPDASASSASFATPGTPGAFDKVYALVACIPPGKVMTYGQISALLDNAISARYVGFAMSSAPSSLGLPCHRVVNRQGEMAPGMIFGGEQRQRALLESEGAVFTDKGRVDLTICRFEP